MNPSRRRFLVSLGGTPLVLGLEQLLRQDGQDKPASRPAPRPGANDPFAQALALMAAGNAPGLGIVLPETAADRGTLLDMLAWFVTGSSALASALPLRAVLVVAPRSELPANERDMVVLFDKTGARVSGITKPAGKPDTNRREWLLALHGLLDEFEAERRRRTKIQSPEPGQKELEALMATACEKPEQFQALVETVAKFCSAGSYPLWYWREAKDPLERNRCAAAIYLAFQRRLDASQRLPFGLDYGKQTHTVPTGCGTSDDTDPHEGMPMIACGMGQMQVRSLQWIEKLRK